MQPSFLYLVCTKNKQFWQRKKVQHFVVSLYRSHMVIVMCRDKQNATSNKQNVIHSLISVLSSSFLSPDQLAIPESCKDGLGPDLIPTLTVMTQPTVCTQHHLNSHTPISVVCATLTFIPPGSVNDMIRYDRIEKVATNLTTRSAINYQPQCSTEWGRNQGPLI